MKSFKELFESNKKTDDIEINEINSKDEKRKEEFMKYVAKKYKIVKKSANISNAFDFEIDGGIGKVYFDN